MVWNISMNTDDRKLNLCRVKMVKTYEFEGVAIFLQVKKLKRQKTVVYKQHNFSWKNITVSIILSYLRLHFYVVWMLWKKKTTQIDLLLRPRVWHLAKLKSQNQKYNPSLSAFLSPRARPVRLTLTERHRPATPGRLTSPIQQLGPRSTFLG